MKKIILFLDFDGVLHPYFAEAHERFGCMEAFEAAVRASSRPVEIVISSTWRVNRDLAELRSFFSPDIAELIIGKTPVVKGGNQEGGRLKEVLEWLKISNNEDAQWIGVDDYVQLFKSNDPSIEPTVVMCMDKFDEREHELLLKAIKDPVAYAQEYPVIPRREKPRIHLFNAL